MIELAGFAIDARLAALAIAAAAFGGFLRGFVGFGGALALVPVLSIAFSPRHAVAIGSLVGMPAVVQLLPEAVRHADRRLVVPASLAILAAAPFGTLLLTLIDPHAMTALIGVLVMLMALASWAGAPPHIAALAWVPPLAGAISGLLQGASGIGGPPSVAIVLARGGPPRLQRANVIGILASISVAGGLSNWWYGLFNWHVATMAACLLPPFVVSTWLGTRYFGVGGQRHFRVAALALLLVIGLLTSLAGLSQIMKFG